MLETIRQFAEEQLVARGEASEIRAAHSRYFAGREADILALWDSPRQREAYDWFAAELANLRTAFRWSAGNGDLDVAAAIATYAAWLGFCIGNYEPIAWAEELIEPAHAVDHPRLAFLYAMAAMCFLPGRIEDAVGYSEAGQKAMRSGHYEVPFGLESVLGGAYTAIGQPERCVDWCRAHLARGRDTHTLTRSMLVFALMHSGHGDAARSAATALMDAAEATRNPWALSFALHAHGIAFSEADPDRALDALRWGLAIARDSGNRATESFLANTLARLEAKHADTASAFDHLTLAIRNYHDSGSTIMIRIALAGLAAFLDRLGRREPAATIAGYALSPMSAAAVPELDIAIAHLRDVLGEATYESLARKGETMTTAAMVTYAYDQIDQARTELEHPS
jgi:tetratricopeptide (TPR) repeat protein